MSTARRGPGCSVLLRSCIPMAPHVRPLRRHGPARPPPPPPQWFYNPFRKPFARRVNEYQRLYALTGGGAHSQNDASTLEDMAIGRAPDRGGHVACCARPVLSTVPGSPCRASIERRGTWASHTCALTEVSPAARAADVRPTVPVSHFPDPKPVCEHWHDGCAHRQDVAADANTRPHRWRIMLSMGRFYQGPLVTPGAIALLRRCAENALRPRCPWQPGKRLQQATGRMRVRCGPGTESSFPSPFLSHEIRRPLTGITWCRRHRLQEHVSGPKPRASGRTISEAATSSTLLATC